MWTTIQRSEDRGNLALMTAEQLLQVAVQRMRDGRTRGWDAGVADAITCLKDELADRDRMDIWDAARVAVMGRAI